MDYEKNLSNRVELWLEKNVINEAFFQIMPFDKQQMYLENRRREREIFLRQKDTWTEEVEIEILEENQAKRDMFGHSIDNPYQYGCCAKCSFQSNIEAIQNESFGVLPWMR